MVIGRFWGGEELPELPSNHAAHVEAVFPGGVFVALEKLSEEVAVGHECGVSGWMFCGCCWWLNAILCKVNCSKSDCHSGEC